ncbi:MAG TPA: IGHMBP2 family helicase [Saprospiraceae bacterium]|nr:IGHMBP2 family helicase [Saprospiraceae bacterium]
MDHFQSLLSLLHRERDEDLQEFLRQIRERPLADRVERGYSWYPLQVVQTGFALGDKAFVVVERTTRRDEPHQLRSGQTVRFFTQSPHVENAEKQGVINFVERNRMKIILNARDVPDWITFGQLGVDQLFDDRSYREMETALNKVMHSKGDRLAELRDIFTGKKKAAEVFETVPVALPGLNDSQNAAVTAILANRDVTIIHGPPGTGKTTTLVAAIAQLVQKESTVLVTAPSNTAADLLTERLASAGVQVVRVGNISRVDESVMMHTLDSILARHPESKNIKKVKIQAAEYRRQSRQHKRSFGYEERREREHLKQQAKELESWANTLEDKLVEMVLTSAQAITCTLVGANHPVLDRYRFRTCVMDEAAQALEPAAWIPIIKCSRVVLAGDPFQLPPTVKSIEAARGGLSKTLIERSLELLPDAVHLLDVQYRMHHTIMDFSNQYFYEGALKAHDSVVGHRLLSLDSTGETVTVFEPVLFVDTAGTGFEEKINKDTGKDSTRYASKYNPEEALLLREHLLQLLEKFPDPERYPSIGILSPYREQVNYLEDMVREDEVLAPLHANSQLVVNTVDGFQGQERDVIYISLVRSNPKSEIGFLSDYRRMNVAMTRARKLLVVIGDSATIGNNAFYAKFLEYCEGKGGYQSAWEYMR